MYDVLWSSLMNQVYFALLLFVFSRLVRGYAHLKQWEDFDTTSLYQLCIAVWLFHFSFMPIS